MNKIAVLSDSHHKTALLQDAIDHLKSCGAQAIVHCGDFQTLEHLKIVANCGVPYVCVFGNNDTELLPHQDRFKIYQEPHYFKINTLKCKVMHLPYYLTPDVDIVFFGHTHAFESYKKNDTLFINPGELCARNKPLSEYVILNISQNDYIIEYYSKKPDTKNYTKKEFIYER